MTAVNLTQWQVRPGRLAETLGNAAEAKRIFERAGASVRVYQPLIGGPNTNNFLGFVTEHDSVSAYGKFVAKLQTNEQWQHLNQTAVLSAEPAASMVNSTLSVTIPGLETSGPAAKGAGPRVIVATTIRPQPGREADTIAGLIEVSGIITKLGARVTGRNVIAGGPAVGQIALTMELDDPAAFGSVTDRLLASKAYQGWTARMRSENPGSTAIGRAVVIQVM